VLPWPWKTPGIVLSSWSNVTSCTTIKLTVWFLSCTTIKLTVWFLSCYKIFLLSDAMTLTFDLENSICFFVINWSYVQSCTVLKFTVQSLSCPPDLTINATTSNLKNNKLLPPIMVIMYDPDAYSSAPVLPTRSGHTEVLNSNKPVSLLRLHYTSRLRQLFKNKRPMGHIAHLSHIG
jgi:hypothetical protein